MAHDEMDAPSRNGYGPQDAEMMPGGQGYDDDGVAWADVVPQGSYEQDEQEGAGYPAASSDITYVYDDAQGAEAFARDAAPVGDILAAAGTPAQEAAPAALDGTAYDAGMDVGTVFAASGAPEYAEQAGGYERYDSPAQAADPSVPSAAAGALGVPQGSYQEAGIANRPPAPLGASDAASANGRYVGTRVMPPIAPDDVDDIESGAAIAALEARRKRRRRRRVITAVVIALVVGAGGFFALTRRPAEEAEADAYVPPTAVARREDFSTSITSQGPLQPINSETVVPTVDGTLSEMRVSEGDQVNEGDVLFVMKSEALDKAAADANSQLSDANSALTRAESAVSAAYDAYNQGVTLYNAGDNTVDITGLRAQISSAEAARDEANAAVTAANNAVTSANDALDKCTVTAPMSGMVVAVGTEQAAGTSQSQSGAGVYVQLADVSQMKVTVQVNEMDISSVAPGQSASVTFAAVPDVRLDGTVDSIASTATNASADAASSGGVVTFGVTLTIAQPDAQLKPGMTATATILLQDVPDALVIPLAAVRVDADDPSIGIVSLVTGDENYTSVDRVVSLAERDATTVVVTEGLEEGDAVLLADDVEPADGEADADMTMAG